MNLLKIFTEKRWEKIRNEHLRRWNLWLAGLFILQAIVVLILSVARPFRVTVNFLGTDTLLSQAQGHAVLASATRFLFDINLTQIVVLLLVVSAVIHLLAATKLRDFYEKNLKKGYYALRWIELGVVGGLVLVAIGLLVGIQDATTLVLVFGFMGITASLGFIAETYSKNERQTSWLVCTTVCVAAALPWLVIATYTAANYVCGAGTPAYVSGLIGSVIILVSLVVANTYLGLHKVGYWAEYAFTERVYMVLIFVLETAAVWQIFMGSLRP